MLSQCTVACAPTQSAGALQPVLLLPLPATAFAGRGARCGPGDSGSWREPVTYNVPS